MSEQSQKQGGSIALPILIGLGLVAGVVMAGLTLLNPSRGAAAIVGGVPTPVPDTIAPGKPAPDFTGMTPGGKQVTLSSLRGHPVAINFWATWCAPCQVEMPALQAASVRYADQGLAIVAVDAGESPSDVQAFLDSLGLTFTAVLDPDGSIGDLYQVRVFPTTIWVDADGIIRAEQYGVLTDTLIDSYVRDLLSYQDAAKPTAIP